MYAHDLALLVLVATPPAAVVALNVYLYFAGDRDLLLPWPTRDYEPVATPQGHLMDSIVAEQQALRDREAEEAAQAEALREAA